MPRKKKRAPRSAQTISIHDFNGPQQTRDALPSAPAMREPESGDQNDGRSDKPWERKRRNDMPASRAEESHSWRSVRGQGGGGGGGFGGGGGGGSSWGSSQRTGGRTTLDALETRNRFDTQDSRGSSRYGNQDSRFGGRQTQDPRFGGDTRPAHLRNRFKKPGQAAPVKTSSKKVGGPRKEKKQEKILSPEELAAKERAKAWDATNKQDAAEKLAAELKAQEEEEKAKPIEYLNEQSPLEMALADEIDLNFNLLPESFARLDFKKTPAQAVCILLADSMVLGKFALSDLVKAIASDCKSEAAAKTVVVGTLKNVHAKGKKVLNAVIANNALESITSLINNETSEEEFDAYLKEQDLYFLKPCPDLSEGVQGLLDSNAAADAVLKYINSQIEATQAPNNVAIIIVSHVLGLVFESKSDPNLGLVDTWAAVLQRCEPDVAIQMQMLFATQRAWHKAGAVRKNICPLFKKLHEAELVTFPALDGWRSDRSRVNAKGKPQALLAGCSNWITEITPPPPVEEDDEEEEDEETEPVAADTYLNNPNAEFFG